MKADKIGFLVTHGTDTMAWGVTMLQYMLKNFRYYVIMTGSQFPMQPVYSSSDGYPNVRVAVELLARAHRKIGPNNVLVVFGYGKQLIVSGLMKIKKWDMDAFIGVKGGESSWDDFKIYKADIELEKNSLISRLDELYIIRTGGTIEADTDPKTGALDATSEDIVRNFIKSDERLVECFNKLPASHLVVAKDSSNMDIKDWIALGDKITEIASQYDPAIRCDKEFDFSVRVLYTNPFMRSNEYEVALKNSRSGLVVAGYGGGNCNLAKDRKTKKPEPCSMERMLDLAKKQGTVVVLTSQVPEEPSDFRYNVGKIPISDYGALPSGNLSVPECQIRLAYILGHRSIIEKVATEHKITTYDLARAAFIAGLEFRNEFSRRDFQNIIEEEIALLDRDPFMNMEFEDALRIVAQQQPHTRTKPLSEKDLWADIKRDYREIINHPTSPKVEKFKKNAMEFLKEFPENEHFDCVTMYLGDMYVLLRKPKQAEELYRKIKKGCRLKEEPELLDEIGIRITGLNRDEDDDHYSDTMEFLLGTDPKSKLSHPPEEFMTKQESKMAKRKKK